MYEFVEKWDYSNRITNVIKNDIIPKYLKQFDETEEKIILKMLEKVIYYNSDYMDNLLSKYSTQLKKMQVIDEKCIIGDLCSEKRNSNSQKVLSNINKEISIVVNILEHDLDEYNIIYLVDDYCGSGETAKNFLDKLNLTLIKKKKVIYYPILITEQAYDFLKSCDFENLELSISFIEKMKASYLSRNCIYSIDELSLFMKISNDKRIPKELIKGLNGVEDLFSCYFFTPNDSLGLLWYSERIYKPVFRRNGKHFTYIYRYLTKQQQKTIRDVIIFSRDEKKRIKSIVGLLLFYGYDKRDIENFLNITDVDEIIREIIQDEVIIIDNDKYKLGRNYTKYYRKTLKTNIIFGDTLEKEDRLENNLISLIK